MSEENVEIVRRCYGLLSARDFSAVAELTHPDIVIDLSRNVFNPATYRGRDGVRRWIEAVEEIWKDFQLDPEELIDVGHSLFSCTRISGKGRGSGVEAEMRMFGIWTLREGKVSRVTGGIETGPKPSKPPSGRSSRFGREAAVPRFAWERSAFPTGGVSRPGPMADTHAVPSPLIEFPADDPERALRFWNGVLGAELTPRRGDAGAGWETDGDGLRLGVHERGPGPGDTASLPYFTVPDLSAALERVQELGGSVIHPGERWAVCRDSEGSPFALAANCP